MIRLTVLPFKLEKSNDLVTVQTGPALSGEFAPAPESVEKVGSASAGTRQGCGRFACHCEELAMKQSSISLAGASGSLPSLASSRGWLLYHGQPEKPLVTMANQSH